VYEVFIQSGEKQVKEDIKTQFKFMRPEILHFSGFLNVKNYIKIRNMSGTLHTNTNGDSTLLV